MARGDLLQLLRRVLGGTALVASIALLGVVTGCGSVAESTAESSCSDVILSDWADGRIDGIYNAECYLAAIDALPEDVRAYSSAEDDISRALQALRTSVEQSDTSETVAARSVEAASSTDDASRLRQVPALLLALTGAALVVVAGGAAATVARRIRQRR